MVFVHPDWFTGLLTYGVIIGLPIIIGVIAGLFLFATEHEITGIIVLALFVAIIPMCGGGYIIHEIWEVPSVDEKIITVQEWQPKPGLHSNERGMMVVDSADDLMLVTADGEGFLNEENFWFQKFNTRDVFNDLKVNGTYKIKYYGWREGFNNGFPNILSVEEIVDENNTMDNDYNKYFGNVITSY